MRQPARVKEKRRGKGASAGKALAWLAAATFALTLTAGAHAKLQTWRQEGAAAFSKHHREHLVISDQGHVRLGRSLQPTGPLAAERVWDLARGRDGAIYAATGDSGKVFRQEPQKETAWTVALDAADTQALSLVAMPDGKVYAGTGPSGQLIEVTDPEHNASRPDPKVQYIWDLAADAEGNVLAATGPTGQLWKRSRDGKWSLVFDSKANHLLCVAVAPDGTTCAGSDGEGLIYRIDRGGKVSVLYDAPQTEVRSLLFAPDGTLYAGTAAEAGGGGTGGARGAAGLFSRNEARQAIGDFVLASSNAPRGRSGRDTRRSIVRVASSQPPTRPQSPPPAAGSAAPRPISPGDNAVYRIDADGVAREIFRAHALIYALCWSDDRLLFGTGPDGQLYEIREQGAENASLAKLENGQILSLLAEPGGGVRVGTGDPGSVLQLSSGYVSEGLLVSEVYDAKLPSRFGALSWKAETPAGTAIAVQVRSGNVGEPDETWSAWSADQTDPASARALLPPGRFVQYRVKLSTRNPERSPELLSVALSMRSSNLPPEISKLDVPDLSTADGTTHQTRLNLRWDVSDPNDDELNFTVQVRKEGWPSWITLFETPITERNYSWDSTAFPSGSYRVRLVASDRPSNSAETCFSRDRESPPFLIDHEPPQITVRPQEKKAVVVLADALTRVTKAELAIDGGPWTPVFPDDGLFDTLREQITVALPELKPGTHLLMVRGTDAAGNVGSGDALFVVGN
ncbi:MAG: hypothetical protein ACLP7Q_10800 [Isosphaeraceae bacterium]